MDFEGVVDAHENGDFVKAASKMLDAESVFLAMKEKHYVLNALNGFATVRPIHAVPITVLKFKNYGETEQEVNKFETQAQPYIPLIHLSSYSLMQNGCMSTR